MFREVHGKDLGYKAMIPRILDHMHSTKDYQIKLSKDDEKNFFFTFLWDIDGKLKLPFLDSQKRSLFPNYAAPSSD